MTFQTPLALLGLLVLLPLALIHPRRPTRYEVPSTLLWQQLGAVTQPRSRPRGTPPLQLILQALVVIMVVGALARPATPAGAARIARHEIYVVDAGALMRAHDVRPDRFAAAQRIARNSIARAPADSSFGVIAAGTQPTLLASGASRATARRAIAALIPSAGPADLGLALRLAAGLVTSQPGRAAVTVIRALGDPLPPLTVSGLRLTVVTVGRSSNNQALETPSAACQPGSSGHPRCLAFARVRNSAAWPVTDELDVTRNGTLLTRRSLMLPPRSVTPVSLAVPARAGALQMRLSRSDILPLDNTTRVALPAAHPSWVAVIGQRPESAPFVRAFAALPGVTVRWRPPSRSAAAAAGGSSLLVLAGWQPGRRLPHAPAILLAGPPVLPGGGVSGGLAGPVVSGTDNSSGLLTGVDLTSLSIHAARRLRLPDWLAPVVWAPGGALLAAGTNGTTRLAVLAFAPGQSNLPTLAAFPLLMNNVLRWAGGALGGPPAGGAAAGTQPAVVLRGPATQSGLLPGPRPWWPWTGLAALLALVTEAFHLWLRSLSRARRRRIARAAAHPSPGLLRSAAGMLRIPVRRPGALLRAGSGALLALALAVPGWPEPGGGSPVLVLDRSASISPAGRAVEAAWLNAFRRAGPAVTWVNFSGVPGWGQLAGPAGAAGLAPASTNIEAALRLALGIRRHAAPGRMNGTRIVLVSDGLATAGGIGPAAAAARAAGVPVDVVPLAQPTGDHRPVAGAWQDAAVTRLEAPAAVWRGDTVPLLATVHSTEPGTASLALAIDGRATGRAQVRLRAGDNPLLFNVPARHGEWQRYRLTVAMPGDRVAQNNTLDAVTHVEARPSLMYVQGAGSGGHRFGAQLRRLGFAVRAVRPAGLPASSAAFGRTRAVVLDDVPGGDLHAPQLTALASAVGSHGLGLLALGGHHSLTASWYRGTPLARALPVAGTGSSGAGGLALELVLDRSGSMADLAGTSPKIDMARAAALEAVRFARRHGDDLGVVSFDTAPHVLVPVGRVTAGFARRAARALLRMPPSGGTNIYGGLRAGFRQLTRGSSGAATVRAMILLTDGVSQSAHYDALLRQCRSSRVSLSTVGLGGQVDSALLRGLASGGRGRYYYTGNAASLPRIFATEIRRSTLPAQVTGRTPAVLAASVPAVRSLAGERIPPVTGYDATQLKPTATAALVAARPGSAPLLAQWQYGLGRVAAWTPGAAAGWAGRWAERPAFWNDVLRWLLPGPPIPALAPSLVNAGPGAQPAVAVDPLTAAGVIPHAAWLTGTVTPPRGPSRRLTMTEAAPGRYTAALPQDGAGVYRLTIRKPGDRSRGVSTELAVGYPAEYLPSPVGTAVLGQLAAVTGGQVLAGGTRSAAAWERAHNGRHTVTPWWTLTLAAFGFFLAAAFLRLLPRRRSSVAGAGGQGEDDQLRAERAQMVDS